mmetsp:Transcript_39545/g.82150  ORF Transcript_39545/g.82150 Transcript_39545/m.82150 type:complete len:81 (+) Transcript_39545:5030-5272(+)
MRHRVLVPVAYWSQQIQIFNTLAPATIAQRQLSNLNNAQEKRRNQALNVNPGVPYSLYRLASRKIRGTTQEAAWDANGRP